MSMNTDKITEVLEEIVTNNQFLQMAYVTDADGIQITENIAQPWIEKAKEISRKGDDRSSRPWFASIIKDGKSSVTDYYISKTTEELCVTATAPITNANGEFVGVLAMDFNFSNLAVAAEEDTKNISLLLFPYIARAFSGSRGTSDPQALRCFLISVTLPVAWRIRLSGPLLTRESIRKTPLL